MNNSNNAAVKFTLLAGIDADKATTNERLCKVIYKADKTSGKKRDSIGAIIPTLGADDVMELLANKIVGDWVATKFMQVQDSLVRAALESASDNTILVPDADAIKVAIIKEMETSGERTRLSGDSIKKWVVDSGLAASLAAAFAAKLGIAADDKKISGVVTAYAENISLLAGKSPLPENVMVNIIKALDMAPNDNMKDKLLSRVEVLTSIDLDAMLEL